MVGVVPGCGEHALAFHAHDPRGRAHTCTRTRTRTVASRALCRPRSEPALAPSQVSSRCCPEPGHLCLEPAAGERARQGGREGGSLGRPASHVAPRPPGLAGPSLHHVHSPQGPGPELLICFPPGLMVRDLYASAPLRHFNQALGGASGAEPGAAAPMGSVGHCPHPPSCWGPAPSVGGEPRSPFMGFMGTDTGHRGALLAPTGGQALVSGSRPGKAPSIPASGGCWVPWGTVRGGRSRSAGACGDHDRSSPPLCLALPGTLCGAGQPTFAKAPLVGTHGTVPHILGGETEELRGQVWGAAGRACGQSLQAQPPSPGGGARARDRRGPPAVREGVPSACRRGHPRQEEPRGEGLGARGTAGAGPRT